MDLNILGICISATISFLAIAIAIFFGLRSFTNSLGERISNTKNDIIMELSGIKGSIIKINEKACNLWDLANIYISNRMGTIEVKLGNFGTTKVWAEPREHDTIYWVQVEKGKLSGELIDKISKKTSFDVEEREMLGNAAQVENIGGQLVRLYLPSTDPKLCTSYMSKFLKWLDTKYVEETTRDIKTFEEGISV